MVVPRPGTVEGVLGLPTLDAQVRDVASDDVLQVRTGPGVEYGEIGVLAPTARVAATAEVAAAVDGGRWRLVNTELAGAGWVNAAFLAIPRSSEETLVDRFIAFASNPNDETFAALPLGDSVELGLASMILRSSPAADLRREEAWLLDAEYFRAYSGPFSAVELLQTLVAYNVVIGAHPHCASDPVPAPPGYESLTRVSVQPRSEILSSCLEWFTVDFSINGEGLVQAITLDLWEP